MTVVALAAGMKSLLNLEALSQHLSLGMRRCLKISRRLPDTTLRDALVRTSPGSLRQRLHVQIKAAWRRKAQFNRELKRLMLGHAFTLVDSVWFVVGASNWRSRRAMEKIGGVLVPTEEAPIAERVSGRVFYRIRNPCLL